MDGGKGAKTGSTPVSRLQKLTDNVNRTPEQAVELYCLTAGRAWVKPPNKVRSTKKIIGEWAAVWQDEVGPDGQSVNWSTIFCILRRGAQGWRVAFDSGDSMEIPATEVPKTGVPIDVFRKLGWTVSTN